MHRIYFYFYKTICVQKDKKLQLYNIPEIENWTMIKKEPGTYRFGNNDVDIKTIVRKKKIIIMHLYSTNFIFFKRLFGEKKKSLT